jgi:phosphatidylserine decarboxylase
VATPLGAILDWTMGTPAGFAAFRDPRINAMLKKILTAWCKFLSKKDSLYVLNDSPSGWKCAAAQKAVGIEQYEHDPEDEHWGFASWNDFFTRRFKDGQRPIASPDDDKVIVSACESTPYGIATDVQRQDRFWINSQPYSLQDMLANDESVDQFIGGTVYQAFLSATNYHRWHSPVADTVLRAFVQEGTYCSEADSEGADAVEPTNSQSYLAHVAARVDHPHRRRRSRHRPGGLRAGRHVGRLLLHHPLERQARLPRDEGCRKALAANTLRPDVQVMIREYPG